MAYLTDIFGSDAFSDVSLTDAIRLLPPLNYTISKSGLFKDVPVSTTKISVESEEGVLTIVPTTHRGGPGVSGNQAKRKIRNFNAPHIQVDDSVSADEVLNVRKFGSADPMSGVQEVIGRKLEAQRRSIEASWEYLGWGALNGVVTYPTGSVDADLNLFTEFGTSKQTVAFALGTTTTKVLQAKVSAVFDAWESALGYRPSRGYAYCDSTMFRALIAHPEVQSLYLQQQAMYNLAMVGKNTENRMSFDFGGILFQEYHNAVAGVTYETASVGVAVPEADIYRRYLAPADIDGAAGTLGQDLVVNQWQRPDKKAWMIQAQSNPLYICTRPRALVAITVA